MKVELRSETPDDYLEITKVNDRAFGRPNEGKLVQELRSHKRFIPQLSLVAVSNSKIVGHILLFPIQIQAGETHFDSLSLGPIAVLPEFQKRGIGSKLIQAGHEKAREHGFYSIILLGHPGYYPRFGYQPADRWNLTNPWGIAGEAFMAIELQEGSLNGKAGEVQYPSAFNQAT